MPDAPTTAQRLGHAASARLLIINADDFGMCHSENVATMDGIESGSFCSTTVMVPCPWFEEAAAYARQAASADVGVHITHTSEWATYKWGPVLGQREVPSLVDERGYLFADVATLYAAARLDQVEQETRAQIDKALAAGIDVTHLDSHMGTVQLESSYHEMYVRLAAEYRLPIRMLPHTWLADMGMGRIAALADELGIVSPDHFWNGGPQAPEDTGRYWTEMLRSLKPGVTELYIHAALDEPEMRAISESCTQRAADHAFFTAPSTRQLLADLQIQLVGYRQLRALQRREELPGPSQG